MATSSGKSQRAWRSNCPGCGAPLEFRSAASTHAVCGYCSTTVVRDGDSLKSLGKLSALFEDYSPLQLGVTGQFQSKPFTVVGRLQYAWKEGMWNEWYCWFDSSFETGSAGDASAGDTSTTTNSMQAPAGAWLSEDNGQFVWMIPANLGGAAPPLESLRLNQNINLAGREFEVAAITEAHLASGQGELPRIAPLQQPFTVAELRNSQGLVLSLDYSQSGAPTAYLGSAVKLEALQLKGLRDDSQATIKGARQFACPHCGANVTLNLEKTKSLTCGSCNSLIDTSQGVGQEVVSALQSEPIQPTLALGTSGKLKGVDWQLVGYQSMLGKDLSAPDETFGWEEYLMFNKTAGFAFLADTQEGWSISRPLSGSAKVAGNGKTASYLGSTYRLKESYQAEVNYVAGEFYWQVKRGSQTAVVEFINTGASLVREQSQQEVTWSRSEPVDSTEVARAFAPDSAAVLRPDVTPMSGSKFSISTIMFLLVFFFIVVIMLSQCSQKDCDPSYQNCATSSGTGVRGWGGSYGGGSSGGGGHK
jgi:ribosomal protein S27E